jgi:hypothetical protein
MNNQIVTKKKLSGWWYVAIWGCYLFLVYVIAVIAPDAGAFQAIILLLAIGGTVIFRSSQKNQQIQAYQQQQAYWNPYQQQQAYWNPYQQYAVPTVQEPVKSYEDRIKERVSSLVATYEMMMGTGNWLIQTIGLSQDEANNIMEFAMKLDARAAFAAFAGFASVRGLATSILVEVEKKLSDTVYWFQIALDEYGEEAVNAYLQARTGIKPELNSPAQNPRYISRDVMAEVMRRDGGKCVRCGSSSTSNVQLLCQTCNRSKGNREVG